MELLFLEDRAQALCVREQGLARGRTLVAVSAEALQAAEEYGLEARAVGDLCSTTDLVPHDRSFFLRTMRLAQEIETFMAARQPDLAFGGFGFLSANTYYLAQTAIGVASRLHLMRAALDALRPGKVLLYSGRVPPEFSQNGLSISPWAEGVAALSAERGAGFELLPEPTPEDYARCVFDPAQGQVCWPRPEMTLAPLASPPLPEARGLRLLLAGLGGYDWTPVVDTLLANGASCSLLALRLPGPFGRFTFKPEVEDLGTGARRPLGAGMARQPEAPREGLRRLFRRWCAERPEPPRLEMLGIDVFPALRQLLETWAATLPGVVRHTDAVAEELFSGELPHLLCFFAQPWVCARRLIQHARQRGVPVVEYLHGGGYSEIVNRVAFEFLLSDLDLFLTYGEGYAPGGELCRHVPHVPVGSTRIEQLGRRRFAPLDAPRERLRVLWVGGFSTGNIHGDYWYEDTRRYRLQRECLAVLARNPALEVLYRPYPGQAQMDGTSRLVRSGALPGVLADGNPAIEDSLAACDLVITDVYSGTIWPETLVLDKPLLLYFDPKAQPMTIGERSAELIGQAMHWCRTGQELRAAVERLSRQGRAFVEEACVRDASAYLAEAMLHGDDGGCAYRAAAFCAGLRGGAGALADSRKG